MVHKDGSRNHISREYRDSLLLSKLAKLIAPNKYLSLEPVHVFKRTATENTVMDMQKFGAEMPVLIRRFLFGLFIWQLEEILRHERLETPNGMADRLERPPSGPYCVWSVVYAQAEANKRQRAT